MSSVSSNSLQSEKPSFIKNTGAVLAGATVGGLISLPQGYIAPKLINSMQKVTRELSNDEFKAVNDATSQILSKTKLDEKGVKIYKSLPEQYKKIVKLQFSSRNVNGKNNFISKFMKTQNPLAQIMMGRNAAFLPNLNSIVVPKKLSLSVFHETGHAMNFNFSKIGKFLQKTRMVGPIIGLLAGSVALFKTKKASGEKPQGFWDKTTTFIKENIGKITFASFLPMFAEEAMATAKGNKLAKEMLSPDLAKKVAKTNKYGLITYACLATLSAFSIWAGVKIKDAIVKPKGTNKKENAEKV